MTLFTTSEVPYLICDVGINHNGSITNAENIIRIAKNAGMDAIKMQKRTVDIVYTQEFLQSHRESPYGKTQGDQKYALEFGEKEYDYLNSLCKDLDIDFFASAWDIDSLKFLRKYEMPYNKIASAMVTHNNFIHTVAEEGKNTFISTGMSTLDDIDDVVDVFEKKNTPFVLLHAVSKYPCEDSECNIAMISTLQARYSCQVGYSGHERGITPSVLAVAWGAVAIERHGTWDRTAYGSDQSASLEKHGMELLVRDCRGVNDIIGDGMKRILPEEKVCASKLRYWG